MKLARGMSPSVKNKLLKELQMQEMHCSLKEKGRERRKLLYIYYKSAKRRQRTVRELHR